MTYFKLDTTPFYPDKYIIKLDPSNLPFKQMRGSFTVFQARLMNMEFHTYLRFCRDMLDAEIIGKHSLYPIILFDATAEVNEFVKLLNKKVELALHYHENPYKIKEIGMTAYKENLNVVL